MRMMAGILVIVGLAALSGQAFTQHHVVIVMPSIALAVLWGLAIALRWPRPVHTGCLGLSAVLCALSTSVGMPVLVSVFCLSAVLYGWDLTLMELRTAAHARNETFCLERRYAFRCLRLAGLGFGVTLLARFIHVRMSFFSALAISWWCSLLFLIVYRRTRRLMGGELSTKEKRTTEPSA